MDSFILPLDKPVGPTSHDMVAAARRALATKRIGHTGTLDPFASGLLLLCVGQATRLAEYLTGLSKVYVATARLDGSTTTDDDTGERVSSSNTWKRLEQDDVRAAFAGQVGTLLQRPSSYSAKKIDGQRAYDRARRGEAVMLAPVKVSIYDIRIAEVRLPEVEFEVYCSSGTYVRAIARDAGESLGTGGYLSALRRVRVGEFHVDAALTLETLNEPTLVRSHSLPMTSAVAHLPWLEVNADETHALRNGRPLMRQTLTGEIALVHNGELVAMGVAAGDMIQPRKVFGA